MNEIEHINELREIVYVKWKNKKQFHRITFVFFVLFLFFELINFFL